MVSKKLLRRGAAFFGGVVVLAATNALAATNVPAAASPVGLGRTLEAVPGDPGLVSSALACPPSVSPLSSSCVLMGIQLSGFVTSGGEWTITKAVPGDGQSLLADGVTLYPNGVSCPTATTCVVAGGLHTGVPVLAWFTNGALTKTVPVPGDQKVVLIAISCPNANLCIAVGRAPVGTSDYVTQGAVVVARGVVVGSPRRVVGTTVLNAVSCGSATSCLAVGAGGHFTMHNGQPSLSAAEMATFGKIGAAVPLTNAAPAPAKLLLSLPPLTAVSCGSPRYCGALGNNQTGPGSVVLTLHDGTLVHSHLLPPADSGAGISCTSGSTCVAVGSSQATTSRPHGLVFLINNSAVTSTYTLPVPAALSHISCPIVDDCLVEGDFGAFPGAPGTVVVTP
jgi:hypothetical protein